MIVSHLHKLIFLKTRKTGGTSLEIALSQTCGPDDIITEISPEDEETRRQLGFRGPQNFMVAGRKLQNHARAAVVRNAVGNDVWTSYFKVAIERNPYDMAISRYWWSTRNADPRPSISEFLMRRGRDRLSNWPIYTIDNSIAVDHVMRYENLADELRLLEHRLGIPPLQMVRAKGGHRRDRRRYSEVLSSNDRRVIEDVCANEIAFFDYAW